MWTTVALLAAVLAPLPILLYWMNKQLQPASLP
jgi:hypothetical protein